MSDLRQAAQQALEALDQLTDAVDGTGFSSKPAFDFALDAITALRAALAGPVSDTLPPLLPCPFCGSAKIEYDNGDESSHYRCRNCGASSGRVYYTDAESSSDDYSASDADALEAWNRRAALAEPTGKDSLTVAGDTLPPPDRADWLADKLHNGGDYGKEAAALLMKQAREIERLTAALAAAEPDVPETRFGDMPERLRTYSADTELSDRYSDAMQEAADEIERLTAALAAAVAAERERCAELMERQHTWISSVSAARLIRGDSQVLMTGFIDASIAPRQRGPECDYPTCSASCGAVERYCHKAPAALSEPVAAAVAEPVASVTECEACFTPDVCQLRGTCDHYAAERLRVAAPPQREPQWQPIETAPHDGKPLLLWCDTDDGGEPMILHRDSKGRWLYEGEPLFATSFYIEATHWMPLPDAPASAPKEQA